jgi:hypothetical protein
MESEEIPSLRSQLSAVEKTRVVAETLQLELSDLHDRYISLRAQLSAAEAKLAERQSAENRAFQAYVDETARQRDEAIIAQLAAETQCAAMAEALKPFAGVIDELQKTQELDRDVGIEPFPTVHFNGSSASGGYTLKPEYFRAAHKALYNLPARSVAMEKVVEAARQFKVLVEHRYFQAEKIGEVRQKLFDTINEYNALLLPLDRGMK